MPFPDLPNYHTLAVLLLTVGSLYLFRREDIPLETSCLLVLILLAIGFELWPYYGETGRLRAVDFFLGFGHEALVAVCALMIAGQGLVRTGALEPIGRLLTRFWRINPIFSLLVTLMVAAILSAFMNNTPIVVLLLPILVSVSLRLGQPPSGVLMPMGFATLVGGMSTTIGTSTNLLVVSVAADLGLRRFNMFEFLIPAAIAGLVGIIYLWLIAPRLLPTRAATLEDASPRVFTAHLYIAENSNVQGKTLTEIVKQAGGRMKVDRIQRGENTAIMPMPDAVVRAGDRLVVSDTPDQLKDYEMALGAQLFVGSSIVDEEHPLIADDQQLTEVVVVPGSPLAGSTLKDVRFISQYQMVVLALHRGGKAIELFHQGLSNTSLYVGDILLLQGPRQQVANLKKRSDLLVLDATTDIPQTSKAPLALTIMAGIIVTAALNLLPISISALAGVMVMILTGCLSWREAAQALSAQVVMIVVASLALGVALIETGGAEYLAQSFVAMLYGAPPELILSGLMLLMAILTNIVSNNAAAVIGTPIAISVANQLGLSPEAFVIAVLFGANMSYATPMAYKTNLLVMNAGGYLFSDFVRIGVPLVLLMWLVLSFVLPVLYPL